MSEQAVTGDTGGAGASEPSIVIEASDVNLFHGGQAALEHITFQVTKGSYVGIIGPNGAGKTTLLTVLLGLTAVDSGEIKLFGQRLQDFKDWWKIGYLPQRASQQDARFPITVREVVSQGRIARAGLFRRLSTADRRAIDRALEITETTQLSGQLIGNLSGGERQRAFIARALASEPEVLVLDEPAMSIDLPAQEHLYQLLEDFNKEMGLTVLFVSHDIDVIVQEASDIICLNGQMVCHTHPKGLTAQHLRTLFGENVRPVHHHHEV